MAIKCGDPRWFYCVNCRKNVYYKDIRHHLLMHRLSFEFVVIEDYLGHLEEHDYRNPYSYML